jgi:hypothetical protein
MKRISLVIVVLLAGCAGAGQSGGRLDGAAYDAAKSICKTSSHCTGLDSGMSPPGQPGHWYGDGYGRDERAFRH